MKIRFRYLNLFKFENTQNWVYWMPVRWQDDRSNGFPSIFSVASRSLPMPVALKSLAFTQSCLFLTVLFAHIILFISFSFWNFFWLIREVIVPVFVIALSDIILFYQLFNVLKINVPHNIKKLQIHLQRH